MSKVHFLELKLQITNMDQTDLTHPDLTIDQKWEKLVYQITSGHSTKYPTENHRQTEYSAQDRP